MATIGTSGFGTIGRSPEEVWEYFVDPARLHLWVKDVEPGGSWIDNGSPDVVGSRYRIDYSYGRKTNEIIFEVTSSERGRKFGVNTVSGPFPMRADYELSSPDGGQTTDVSYTMVARSDSKFTAVMFVLTGWLARPFMKRRLNKELVDLQAVMNSE